MQNISAVKKQLDLQKDVRGVRTRIILVMYSSNYSSI